MDPSALLLPPFTEGADCRECQGSTEIDVRITESVIISHSADNSYQTRLQSKEVQAYMDCGYSLADLFPLASRHCSCHYVEPLFPPWRRIKKFQAFDAALLFLREGRQLLLWRKISANVMHSCSPNPERRRRGKRKLRRGLRFGGKESLL